MDVSVDISVLAVTVVLAGLLGALFASGRPHRDMARPRSDGTAPVVGSAAIRTSLRGPVRTQEVRDAHRKWCLRERRGPRPGL